MQRAYVFVAMASMLFSNLGLAAAEDIFSSVPKVIYGDDNRLDLYQVTNQLHLDLADSTVALVKAADTSLDSSGITTSLIAKTFGEEFNLCSEEPFREQPSAAFCSGFLVDADTVVTAGHCIKGPNDCAATKFVFGYALKTSTGISTNVKTEEVYKCAEVVHSETNNGGADFAVVKLDRRVIGHRSLDLRLSGDISIGQSLVMIGHPSGLPVKVAAGASVRKLGNGFFVASTDSYGGNSGSAVFNDTDGKVEGILVRGEEDFVYKNGCAISNRCTEEGCRGEDITMITKVLPFLSASSTTTTPPVVVPTPPVVPAAPTMMPITPPIPTLP